MCSKRSFDFKTRRDSDSGLGTHFIIKKDYTPPLANSFKSTGVDVDTRGAVDGHREGMSTHFNIVDELYSKDDLLKN